jgi:N-acetylglutamate synthase-like GNAT family acetyltransferase
MNYNIKVFAYGTDEYRQALALRTDVLRTPLGLKFTPEELEKDKHDVHLGLFLDNKILACLTLSITPDNKLKMRQVAVNDHWQHKGVGTLLSASAEDYARENGVQVIYCHARKTAAPFYEKLGYKIVSDEFTEVNIPHYVMEKLLKQKF